jgi:hypothetical protein
MGLVAGFTVSVVVGIVGLALSGRLRVRHEAAREVNAVVVPGS